MSFDIWVDFNDVTQDGHVSTLERFIEPGVTLTLGGRVVVGDYEGNTCGGIVIGFMPATIAAHNMLEIQLDLRDFMPAEDMDDIEAADASWAEYLETGQAKPIEQLWAELEARHAQDGNPHPNQRD